MQPFGTKVTFDAAEEKLQKLNSCNTPVHGVLRAEHPDEVVLCPDVVLQYHDKREQAAKQQAIATWRSISKMKVGEP